ncbi:MAG: DUF262 domain-containing protein [Armatimonadetes bacterium]|nr:DUF262 domain-containing protein [Armatimonadota bacterium]
MKTQGRHETEDYDAVEGLDQDEDSSLGEYPIDTLLIRNETRTVHDVLRRIEAGSFTMDPDFQRDFVWDVEKQSKLIESVLMRIPLPVFYLAEDERGKMVVVDGLQRLTTFRRFVKGELRLKLKKQIDLDKRYFAQLSPKLQNRVEDCNLILYVIDSKVPERARLDIFERVNGGVPLTRQQMRNSLYQGNATRFLKDMANEDVFLQATGKSLNPKLMRDREFINRFCSFTVLGVSVYKGDMDEYLADGLRQVNGWSEEQIKRLEIHFKTGMKNNSMLFGVHAFRKFKRQEDRRAVINASLWDVTSTLLAAYSTSALEANKATFIDRYKELLEENKFEEAITRGPSDKTKVAYRFDQMSRLLKEVYGDPLNKLETF